MGVAVCCSACAARGVAIPIFNPPATYPDGSPSTSGPVTPFRQPGEDPLGRRLMAHCAATPRGLWVLKINGVYGTYDYPVDTLIATATEVYMGGHVYEVSAAVGAALEAAGYTLDGYDDWGDDNWGDDEWGG